jgi:hypothetical protein
MMIILTWNIRGLNGRSKQRILQNYIKMEDHDILLIQETKCARIIAEDIIKQTQKGLQEAWPSFGILLQSSLIKTSPPHAPSQCTTEPLVWARKE